MRRRTLILVVVAAVGVAAVLVGLHRSTRRASTAAPPASAVSLVGDSLNVGVEPYLRDRLPRWTINADDEVGRPTSIGLDHLRAAASSLAPYVVISLGTNDPVADVADFRRAVEDAVGLAGPHRCVVWTAIHREGAAYEPFNEALRSVAARNRNLRVVEWGAMVDGTPNYLAADGIHGSPSGYAARAKGIVTAMRGCYDDGVVS